MKFKDIDDEKMRQNVQRMTELGMSKEQIADAMPSLIAWCEQARTELLHDLHSVIDDDPTQQPQTFRVH
jgi:hypothetical protein